MIAELAAANAAFKVIKAAMNNGKDLYDCGESITKYFDNKSALTKKAGPGGKSDLKAFMALEKLKEQEVWLKETMIYAGRPDMYSDWLQFQSDCKKKRDRDERIRLAKRKEIISLLWNSLLYTTITVVLLPITMYGVFKVLGVY